MMVFIYAVLIFLVLRFSVTLFNFLSNPKLGYYGKHFTDKVSIIVLTGPLGTDTKQLLDSIEQQDYAAVEVLVQDNESEDELAAQADGRYLLFLNAATTVHHGLINSLIYRTKVFNLAVLGLLPTLKPSGFLEHCVYPLNYFILLNLLPLRLIRLSNLPSFAAGNTDCLFFDAVVYKAHRWHRQLGKAARSGTDIIKLVKQQQQKAEVLLGNKFVYSNPGVNDTGGLATHLLANFGNSGFVTLIYLALVIAGPVFVLVNFDPTLAALPVGLIFLSRIMIAFLTAQKPVFNVLLHPLQMLLLFVLLLKGIWMRMLGSIKRKK
ncbi:hypothetical protein ABIE26_005146 [Pedobacter africanus]|uniref:Uncharacterized protein n=1 Tax=Pedobacter africanus TaxID=151894 RepID=A0ACC6L4X9_9SPHI|nr:glycosyltransferase family 2 protein [Pedobacter africanus]MDR6786427.1 hypothetical protein [Pedobacter africanus]